MLAFITSLRHPRNSADYSRVEHLLRRTLRSVCRQDHDEFAVVVACNEIPAGRFDPRVEFVRVDFPPPVDTPGPMTGRDAVLRDKGTKLAVALLAAQRHRPDHVMKVDADDFVSRRLAGWSADRPTEAGWYVEHGYVLSDRTGLITAVDGFNERCGTSEILANRAFGLPADLPAPSAGQDELTARLGTFLVRDLLGSHRASVAHSAARGEPLRALPFPGAVYTVGTGENHSGLSRVPRGRPVSGRQVAEFGLEGTGGARAWVHFAGQVGRSVRRRVVRAG
ncbi:glycosyltransferase family 2 protein [Kineococcus rhizosphaerae]|uniref:Glycosyl transferase family 2 n=1 Tax=Kineococcus rhizosphaerae TaxID=559628 RepID=A0A2T0R0Y2_9ACTN|nr:glycosyltransferase family 2 protein [Kineococcus rhizosphaerae]PRY12950.1 hypothetical protein CLV37_109136 [Kineococcus rhizosphaerae]